jgi:hypothetical protein
VRLVRLVPLVRLVRLVLWDRSVTQVPLELSSRK